ALCGRNRRRHALVSASQCSAAIKRDASGRKEVNEMAFEATHDATRTTTVEEQRRSPATTTTTTGRAVEAVLTGLKGYRFLNLTTFCKNGVPVLTTGLFAL